MLKKVKDWDPEVFGAQEVETGGGQGYDQVKKTIVNATGMGHAGGSQFFRADIIDKRETDQVGLVGGYWMSMTKYIHRESGAPFLFFNSHWKHGYGLEQAKKIGEVIHEKRAQHSWAPTLLVGDTNQFCKGHEGDAIRYLTGEIGKSPVVFIDAIAHDTGKSFNPDCRVDFILASAGQWSWINSSIDREGMGTHGTASDHAALMAELVPIV